MRRTALTGLVMLLSACATTHDGVVLLPDRDGKVGTIAVLADGRETILDQPYASARISDGGKVQAQTLDAASVRENHALELSMLPPRPVSFDLYFIDDTDQLDPKSLERFPELAAEIARRPFAEMAVIGHTDTRAGGDYNDRLSMARAETVRAQLISRGFDPARISAAGRGERDLAVPTADGVDEPRNRRVEINVR